MSRANARLNIRGRLLLIQRVIDDDRPVSHVAKELGLSRQCANRWVARFRAEGQAGLIDRSARPRRSPAQTSPQVEARGLALRADSRRGQDWIGPELGVPARTVWAILRRHRVARLRECDLLAGVVIRSSKATAVRFERDRLLPADGIAGADQHFLAALRRRAPHHQRAGEAGTTKTCASLWDDRAGLARRTGHRVRSLVDGQVIDGEAAHFLVP